MAKFIGKQKNKEINRVYLFIIAVILCMVVTVAPGLAADPETPVANFSADPVFGSSPLTVEFTDLSENTPTEWLWDFGDEDDTNSTVQNPVHTYTSAGTYDVSLTATNSAGSGLNVATGYITVTAFSTGPVWTAKSDWNTDDVGTYATSDLADLDGDGDYDLMLGSNVGVIYGYENTGSSSSPVWTARSDWNTPDVGGYVAPDLADLDGDGDYDLLIGENGGATYGYENTGSSSSPVWTANSDWDVSDLGSAVVPDLTDLDGDGDYDLLIGEKTGVTYGYENTGSSSSPVWTENSDWDVSDLGSYTAPATADLDGDGDYDLLIGEKTGVTYGYENTGSSSSPIWTANSDWDVSDLGSYASPATADLDGDGDYDLLIGESIGLAYGYENTGTIISPFAAFSSSPTSGSVPLTVIFKDISTGMPASWAWDFDNDGIVDSEMKNPTYTYNVAGTYTVNLTVTNSAGSDSEIKSEYITVTITVTPVANFSAEPVSGEVSLTVQFMDLSENYPTEWSWDFGDGDSTNSTVQNPVHTYTSAGTYNVTLNATNSAGSGNMSMAGYITVTGLSPPVADFDVVLDGDNCMPHGIAPIKVSFTDNSTGQVDDYVWEYRNYNDTSWTEFSTAQNPTDITFSEVGTYNIRLTVSNSAGSSNKTIEHAFSAGMARDYLTTIQSGTISGDLYIDSKCPWTTTATYSYILPASGDDIVWARLFVNDYSGSGSGNAALQLQTELDSDGDGTFETVLGVEECNIQSDTNQVVYRLNDHVSKVYSDYEAWYDVTDLLNSTTPSIRVTASDIGVTVGSERDMDGRIKGITLIVAYNDGDSNDVDYIVNHGNDWISGGGSSSTTFDAGFVTGDPVYVNLTSVAFSSSGADFTFNSENVTGESLGSGSYWKFDAYNVTDEFEAGSSNTFGYVANDPSFKICIAALKVETDTGTSESAPVAAFTATPTSGTAPLTVTFTDTSGNSPESWVWDFENDGTIDSTAQNPTYVYTTEGVYSVNLTATNAYGSGSRVRSEYITVSSGGTTTGSDVSITGSVLTVPNSAVFAKEPNTVTINTISNSGTEDLTNIAVYLYASDVSDTVPVNSTTIASLGSGDTTSITFVDPTIRSLEGTYVTYTAVIDPENAISESDESNNEKTSASKPVKYNGYKGKTYWEGGSNITTQHVYDLTGDMVYCTQSDSAYKGVGWTDRTETWSTGDLPVPEEATVEEVLLFVPYNWDQTPSGLPDWAAEFNGNTLNITPGTPYTDKSNFGTYPNYMYGLYVVDVTDYFSQGDSNTFTVASQGDNKNALYPSTLVVIYSDSSTSRKQIFINEECDELAVSQTNYATTADEATAYAPFTGMEIDVSRVQEATLYSFAGSAGLDGGEGKLYFNGDLVKSDWPGTSSSSTPLVADVKSYLEASGNEAGIQGTDSGGMCAYQQILVVDYGIVPQANFTVSADEGKIPFEVNFTDNSMNSPESWSWEFGDGGTSELQNPSHTYTIPGIYSVRLNVSNSNGSSVCLAEKLINATWPGTPSVDFTSDVSVGASSLTVHFTDNSTNSPTSWLWEFGDGETSDRQNPSHTYIATGLYTVSLTAYNEDGNSTGTKQGYIEVVSLSELTGYNDIYIETANAPAFDLQGNGTYYLGTCDPGDGLSDLHISTDPGSPSGEVTSTDSLSGTFYVTYTGVRGFQDDVILMLAVNGTVPESFGVDISASGYNWTASELVEKPESIASSSINIAITKDDFAYGLQSWKPAAGNQDYPVFSGEDMNASSNEFRVMFIDLKSGVLGSDYSDTTNNGSIRVNYKFTNLTTFVAFNVYGWNLNNSEGNQAIIDTNGVSSGYTVFSTDVSEEGGLISDFSTNTTSGEVPMNVTFADLTTGDPVSWLWNFGDGGNSTDQNPTHTYSMPGTYSVNLTASNASGSNSTLKLNYINVNSVVLPEADFTSDKTSGLLPLTVKFTDSSTGNATVWAWDFEDDGTIDSTEQNPSYTYSEAGRYSVSLMVENSNGNDTVVKRNYIEVTGSSEDAPDADFSYTPSSGSAPFVVTFTDKSTNSPGYWRWDFDSDGTIDSTNQNPLYTYRSTGTFSVTLTVTNSYGSDTVVKESIITVSGVKNSTKSVDIDSSGTLTEKSDGTKDYSTNSSNATISGNNIVINSGNCTLTIKSDSNPVESGGTYVSSNVTEIELETDTVETTLSGIGNVSGSVNVSLNDIPDSASLEVVIDEGDSGAGTSFQLAAGSSGLDVNNVAYTMNIVKTNLENGQDIKEARITMSVPVSWVNANGGISAIKIIRVAEDGTKEVLSTTYVGLNGDLMVFEGYSPNGLSLFGLASVTGQSSSVSGSSDTSGSDRVKTSRGRLDYKGTENPGAVQSSEEGKILADTNVPSDDGFASVSILKGTLALEKGGESIDEIEIEKIDEDSLPENEDSAVYEFMDKAYEFKPSGATFSPGIEIVFYLTSLDEYEAFNGKEPVIRYYNKASKEWEDLASTLNEDTMTVSATITHFSVYALFAKNDGSMSTELPAAQGAPNTGVNNPVTDEGTTIQASTLKNSSSPLSTVILVFFTIGFVGICGLGTYRFKKSRMEEELFPDKKN